MEVAATKKLEIKNLQKSTKSALVMDDITLTVHAGEIFALVGESDSCKTLLSKIVVNLVKKTSGEVIVSGIPNKKARETAKKIGVSIDQQNFYSNKTAFKTLERYALLHKHPISHKKLVNILNIVDLKKTMHQTLDRYNKCAIARLKIAIAIYGLPEVIILDDPFKDLSPVEARKVRIIIKTIAENNKAAVLLTADDIASVEEICDTVGIIDDGFMVTTKSYNQFIRDDAPCEKIRVMTQAPNYAAKTIEQELHYKTYLCGEWVVIDTSPTNALQVAEALIAKGIDVLAMQRVNRSLSEQFYQIIAARRRSRGAV